MTETTETTETTPDGQAPALRPSELARQYHAHRSPRRPAERLVGWLDRLAPDRFLLDPDVLWAIARGAVEATPSGDYADAEAARRARFEHVIAGLEARYGERINTTPEWVVNRCGGAEFVLATLHASPYEFLFLCGTNMDVHGADSGTYACDVFDFILEGNNRNTGSDPYQSVEETRAGEYTYLGAGQQKIWTMDGPCWMIDYVRGFTPFVMPHGLIENFTVLANPLNTMANGRTVASLGMREVLYHRLRARLGRGG